MNQLFSYLLLAGLAGAGAQVIAYDANSDRSVTTYKKKMKDAPTETTPPPENADH
jgi:hypothetical protein